ISYQKAEEESLRLNVEKQLTLSRAFQKDKKAFTDQEVADMINNISIKSDITNEELLILEKYYADQEKLRKHNKKDLEENVNFEVALIEKRLKSQLLLNDEQLSNKLSSIGIGSNLTDVENYEKSVYEIKKKYLEKNLNDQLEVYKKILENESLTNDKKEEYRRKLLDIETQIRDFQNQTHIESLEKAKEMEQAFIEIGNSIKNALI